MWWPTNCTDNTAEVARQAGAQVYVRNNRQMVGKGYALDFIFKILQRTNDKTQYEGYFVFDADNLLDENYIAEMNKVFDAGYRWLPATAFQKLRHQLALRRILFVVPAGG